MSAIADRHAAIGFPRYFKIAGAWINSYKVLLIVGIYVGSLASAWIASRAGQSPLRVGVAAMTCAIVGLVGARVYYLLIHAREYVTTRSWGELWDSSQGGWGVFGALITFVPTVIVVTRLIDLPLARFADYLGAGVLAGGMWIRLGCVFNGCCAGRPTDSWFAVRLHDTLGVRKRRVPVQYMEIAWWIAGCVLYLILWPRALPPGTYAAGVLGWYGFGRFFLDPLREKPAVVGVVPIDRFVAALLALGGGGAFVLLVR